MKADSSVERKYVGAWEVIQIKRLTLELIGGRKILEDEKNLMWFKYLHLGTGVWASHISQVL